MKKINLLIDFNNIASKALYVSRKNSNSKVFPSSQQDKQNLIIQLHNAICYEINIFKEVLANVFICCDSKTTFRSDIYPNYKKTRKEKRELIEDIDFNTYNNLMNEYIEYLKTINNLSIIQQNGLEADDLIYFITNDYIIHNISSIIVSSDKDLHQLIIHKKDGNAFILCYNNLYEKRTFTIHKDTFSMFASKKNTIKNKMDINTIMEMMNNTHRNNDIIMEYINNVVNELKITINIEEPNKVLVDKIFYGDTSDNITGIVPKDMKTKIKFTRRQLKDIIGLIDLESENIIEELKNKKKDWLKYLVRKLEIGIEELKIICDNFKRNVKLIYLSNKTIPHRIYNYIPNHFYRDKWKKDIPEMMKFMFDIDDYDVIQKFKVFEY